jgi:hypothetical protein
MQFTKQNNPNLTHFNPSGATWKQTAIAVNAMAMPQNPYKLSARPPIGFSRKMAPMMPGKAMQPMTRFCQKKASVNTVFEAGRKMASIICTQQKRDEDARGMGLVVVVWYVM